MPTREQLPQAAAAHPVQEGPIRQPPRSAKKTLPALLLAALNEPVFVTIDRKRRKITKREGIVTQIVNNAAGADLRATRDTWTHLETGLYDPDIHAVTIAATQPKRLYASTAREVFTSNGLGDTWQALGIEQKWPLPYARGMIVKADDPGVLFAGCGETTTGEKGTCSAPQTSARLGKSCHSRASPMPLCGALRASADANRILAFSLFGEVYVSEDAGASWRKIAREFGEIRTAVRLPN